MLGKVEICGVNTAKLPTLKSDEMTELLRRSHLGDERARERSVSAGLGRGETGGIKRHGTNAK